MSDPDESWFRRWPQKLRITSKGNQSDSEGNEHLLSQHRPIKSELFESEQAKFNDLRETLLDKTPDHPTHANSYLLTHLTTSQEIQNGSNEPEKADRYFCQACKQAREDSGYLNRVAALLRPLHCSKCQDVHAANFFSELQRNEADSARICIGHQGCYSVCPHLRFSLSDIANWNVDTEYEGGTRGCPEFDCLCRNVQIKHQTTGFRDQIQIVLDTGAQGDPGNDFWNRSITKLQKMHKSFASVFCPHFQTTPDWMYRLSTWWPTLYRPGRRYLYCSTCSSAIFCDSRADKAEDSVTAPIELFTTLGLSRGNGMDDSWISKLDPDNYGHFTDQGTKYVTWCDDRRCATTYEHQRCDALRLSAAYHVGENDPPVSMELLLDSLDNRTFEKIKDLERL